jgi:hypothetical protein
MTDAGTLTALARQTLMGLDRTSISATMPTATLVLLLEGLIDLAEPPHQAEMNRRAQAAHMARVMAASKVEDNGRQE